MRKHWELVKTALRALVWRAASNPPTTSLAGLAVWTAVAIVFFAFESYSTDARFSEYGLGLTLGELLLSMALTALVLRPDRRVAAMAALLVTSLFVTAIYLLLTAGQNLLFATISAPSWVVGSISYAEFGLYVVWLTGAYAAVLRSFHGDMRWRGWGRAGAVFAVQLVALLAFPNLPVFSSQDSADKAVNLWEYARTHLSRQQADVAERPKRVDGARVELAQPALMEEAIARLAPHVRGESDVYAIGIAGYAEQDVFIKELDGALVALNTVLPVRNRTIRLINHVDTVEHTPVALRANFAAAVRAIARAMNKEDDVLLLFMTSHGSSDGIALSLPGLINTDLAPDDVAAVLDREGIKNRIVVVSACYSGVFVKPLANDDTIVLTAADEKSTSFGCSNEREWTYFGDAFFNQNLRPDVSIEEAFLNAKVLIGQWEARDGVTPSNPQGHFGPALMARLARIYGSRGKQAPQHRSGLPREGPI